MNKDILVTVITCVYNTPADYLKQAVKSILSQTHDNFEYYIVDDCSKKEYKTIYKDPLFSDKRIKVIQLPQNGGAAIARNAALDRAKGKYIAIMDADDISYAERFEKQIDFMESNPDIAVCGTWFRLFGDKNHQVKYVIDDNDYYRCCLLFKNYPTILNPSAMIRTTVLKDNHIRYDERLRKAQDYGMWVAISRVGKCTNLKEVLIDYRWHSSQITQRLYTFDVNPYDWMIMQDQLTDMGVKLTKEEEQLLQMNYRRKDVDPYSYWQILQKILKANKNSCLFVQDKLEKRVEEQWRQKIFNTSASGIFAVMKKLPKKERSKIIRFEKDRLLNKIGLGEKSNDIP